MNLLEFIIKNGIIALGDVMDFVNGLTVTDINEVYTVFASRGKLANIKKRKFSGLAFCKSGKITYTYNGQNYVADKNSAVFLPSGATYTLFNNEGGEYPLINFNLAENFKDIVVLPINSIESYLKDYERLKKLTLLGGSRLKAISVFYDILDRLLSEQNKKITDVLSPAIDYINTHFCDGDISNILLAKKANISEIYLRKLFKEKYGTTPKQYILSMRLGLAKQRLLEGDESVLQISSDTGFSSVYHFSREFKQKVGISPTKYREQYKRKGI